MSHISSHSRPIATLLSLFLTASTTLSALPEIAQARETPSPFTTDHHAEYVPNQILLKLKDAPSGDVGTAVGNILQDKGFAVKNVKNLLKNTPGVASKPKLAQLANKLFSVYLSGTVDTLAAVRQLKTDSRIAYAEPNYKVHALTVVPNDPLFEQQWDLNNTGQTGGTADADIDAPEAWTATHDSTMAVGVIDTGVDYTHPDLVDNIWFNPSEPHNPDGTCVNDGIDHDSNGFVNDCKGWNFVNQTNDPMDDFGHGTHVAGTIGAKGNNGVGIAGINWNVKISMLKFLDAGGGGTDEGAVEAILYANMMGIKITSNSWGGGGFSQALYDAISAANDQGNLFIAAAGNDGSDSDLYPMYPAAYDLPNIISVAATDKYDNLSYFSNYGATSVDLAAPGEETLSTVPTGSCLLCDPSGYMLLSGTSMATPHVSGAAALLWSTQTSLTALQVKDMILQRAEPLDPLIGKMVSGGRLSLQSLFEVDTTPPNAVTDLSGTALGHNIIGLQWIATGDDGSIGRASRYDVRYSLNPITPENFNTATKATGAPRPSNPGTTETMKIRNLTPTTTYFVALKAIDNVGNTSGLSSVAMVTTKAARTIYKDNVESGQNGWTTQGITLSDGSLWHISTIRSVSPTHAWYYGIDVSGNYNTGGRNISSLTSPVISLAPITNAELLFSQFLDTENNTYFDLAQVQIKARSTGSTWATILQKGSTNGVFVPELIDLSAYDGQEIQIRFLFDTVDVFNNNYEGWYVDDISIRGTPPPNIPPTAEAGKDQTGKINKTLTFDGSLSSDPDGSIVSYAWDFGDGSTAKTAVAKHAYQKYGTFKVGLTVTDNQGASGQDSATVSVTDTVKILSTSYNLKMKKTLTVVASTDAKTGDLTLVSYPKAIKKKAGNTFIFTASNITKPASVTVQSSLGGTATALVK